MDPSLPRAWLRRAMPASIPPSSEAERWAATILATAVAIGLWYPVFAGLYAGFALWPAVLALSATGRVSLNLVITVLLVGDNRVNERVARRMLERLGTGCGSPTTAKKPSTSS